MGNSVIATGMFPYTMRNLDDTPTFLGVISLPFIVADDFAIRGRKGVRLEMHAYRAKKALRNLVNFPLSVAVPVIFNRCWIFNSSKRSFFL